MLLRQAARQLASTHLVPFGTSHPSLPQDKVQQLEAELASTKEALATAQREREAALAAESTALQQQEAAAAAQEEAEARCLTHAEERERAEQEAAKARVDAQRCGWGVPAAGMRAGLDLAAAGGAGAGRAAWMLRGAAGCSRAGCFWVCHVGVSRMRACTSVRMHFGASCYASKPAGSLPPSNASPETPHALQQDGRRQPQVCRAREA